MHLQDFYHKINTLHITPRYIQYKTEMTLFYPAPFLLLLAILGLFDVHHPSTTYRSSRISPWLSFVRFNNEQMGKRVRERRFI